MICSTAVVRDPLPHSLCLHCSASIAAVDCSSPDVLDELGCAGTDSGNDVAGNFSIFFRHCTHSFCPFSSERFGWRSLISSVITRSEETTFFLCSLNGSQQQLLIFVCLVPSMITTELNGCDAQGWLCKAMLWSASNMSKSNCSTQQWA